MDIKEARGVGVDSVKPWTLTASGKKMYFLEPAEDAFDIQDIAKQTGNLCRFTGAVSQFYSVAQHSVMVANLVQYQLDEEGVDRETTEYWDQVLAALLHDAEEAYVNDLASPLKGIIRGQYQWIADGIRRKIFEKYGIDYDYLNRSVKDADYIAMLVERFYFMPPHPDWPGTPESEMTFRKPDYQDPHTASILFMRAFARAMTKRNALRAEGS